MANRIRRLRAQASDRSNTQRFNALGTLLLLPIILITGVLLAVILSPPFASLGYGVKTLDARLTAAGADFTKIPVFPTRSTFYASDGKTVLATVYLDNRELVRLDQVSEPAKQAVLAIEDSGFYSHGAINWNSMMRALVENARAGTVVQGGSTITQQLVKNSLQNTDTRTFANKFQELAISLSVEQQYTKDQIFELYLNQIYLGNGVYGIGTAAHFYFHKSAANLTLTEGAMLAGIVRSPGYYDPIRDPANMLLRRNDVLNRMLGLGWMSAADNAAAKVQPLGLAKHIGSIKAPRHPFFVDYVLRQIQDIDPTCNCLDPAFSALGTTYDERHQALYEGGLRIYTTLDVKWQTAAQAAARRGWAIGVSNPGYIQKPDVAIVSLANSTGAIRTMLSGRDYIKEKHPRDLVTTLHQPGSSFKAYILATAFDEGWSPKQEYSATSPFCAPWWIGSGSSPHCVNNAEGSCRCGYVNLYEATASSINVVFAQLIHDVGPDNVVSVARSMGVTSLTPADAVYALAVGSVGVSPLEHASGYQTIANGGVHCTPYSVESISNVNGVVLQHTPDCHRVLSPDIAAQLTVLLEGVVTGGTGTSANLGYWPTAGKTGTAVLNKDVWFVGFTRQVTTSVWVGFPGNEDPLPNYFGSGCMCFGGWIAAPIWKAYMLKAMAGMPPEAFPPAPPPFGTTSPPPTTKVPDVMGMTQAQAVSALSQAGFNVAVITVKDLAPKGTVVSQNPAGNSNGVPGSIVTIQVSTGVAPMIKIPNVVGMNQANATTALEGLGFVVTVITTPDPLNVGIVLAESPTANTKVPTGITITLTVGA
jgi:penicillin-binding protein 1A